MAACRLCGLPPGLCQQPEQHEAEADELAERRNRRSDWHWRLLRLAAESPDMPLVERAAARAALEEAPADEPEPLPDGMASGGELTEAGLDAARAALPELRPSMMVHVMADIVGRLRRVGRTCGEVKWRWDGAAECFYVSWRGDGWDCFRVTDRFPSEQDKWIRRMTLNEMLSSANTLGLVLTEDLEQNSPGAIFKLRPPAPPEPLRIIDLREAAVSPDIIMIEPQPQPRRDLDDEALEFLATPTHRRPPTPGLRWTFDKLLAALDEQPEE